MSKHDTFRETGGSRSVLHVYHIVTSYRFAQPDKLIIVGVFTQQKNFGSVIHAAKLLLSYVNHIAQFGKTLTSEMTPLELP
jgi:hypothetical protein